MLLPFWRLLGRMGVVIRTILQWTLWEPVDLFVFTPVAMLWRLLGRMGQAFIQVLRYGVWLPLTLIYYPYIFVFDFLIHPVLDRWPGP